ncbi:MAG: hypothetical protein CVU97_04325 [Firmicutes bacterium HGW-Firmicutes-21]|nr:MAG: hypothetical protein CVU97_04325 [Firmicutes bacterium HGW-Firmicutes-21]
MFGNNSKNKLKNDLQTIKIPEMNKVLPTQILIPENQPVKKHKLAFAGFSKVAVLCLLIVVALTSINLPLKAVLAPSADESTADINSSDISNDAAVDPIIEKKVITADIFDKYVYKDEGIPSSREIYISDMLKSKMEEYKGQDVLFRVIVELIYTVEDYNLFNDFIYISDDYSEDEETIKRLEEEADILRNMYIGQKIGPEEIEIIKENYVRLEEIGREITRIKDKPFDAFRNQLYQKKVDFIKNLGVKNIIPIAESSEIKYFFNNGYYIELTEEELMKIAEHGGYMFKLALPDRADGYSRKISDSLVVLLEQADEDEEIHIAVVSVLDKINEFALKRYIPCNLYYNSHLNKEWHIEGEPIFEDVVEYIDDILDRNNISDKRIVSERFTDVLVSYNASDRIKSILCAGFEVTITKSQIIELAEDPDVKNIYPMNIVMDYNQWHDE